MSTTNSSPWVTAARKAVAHPSFVIASLVLLVAALGLNGAVAKMQLHFKKLPVPLARDLDQISPELGDWYQVSRDEPLDREIQDTLNTDKYIFRDYVNLTSHAGAAGAEMLLRLQPDDARAKLGTIRAEYMSKPLSGRKLMLEAALKDKTSEERSKALGGVQGAFPDAAINMAVTYYTGLVNTVAHIPDRCYIAGGFQVTEYEKPTWDLGHGQKLEVHYINFQDQNGVSTLTRNVAYFFHVNGHYECNPEGVRLSLQNLLEKYGYYAKVELMTVDPDHVRSARTMTDFLASAVPEIEKSFPDWSRYQHLSAGAH